MADPVRRHEDLIAWQKARVLTRDVYMATRQETFARDYGLTNQLQRATVSVMANIAEGFERRSQKEFQRFLDIARASCAETSSHLVVAFDVGYLPEAEFERLSAQCREVSLVLGGLRASVARTIARNSELGTRNSS